MSILLAVQSVIGDMGQTMYQDCCYDLQEIRRCADCYRISNEKSEKMWFCIPCNPPHQLVYAKQKGYPYWPAKVMQVNGNVYDVRFFGGHHMRANIEKVFIRPISSTLQSLQVHMNLPIFCTNLAISSLLADTRFISCSKRKSLTSREIDFEIVNFKLINVITTHSCIAFGKRKVERNGGTHV